MKLVKKQFFRSILFHIYRKVYFRIYWKYPNLIPKVNFPHTIEIELTNDCNFSCIHCNRNNMDREVGYLSLELFKKLVDEISNYPISLLRFVGEGEPSIHPELRQIMEYVSSKPFPVEFTTNGTLFDKYSPQEILSWNIDILGISVDGLDKNTYEKIRLNGDYNNLKQNVINFHQARKCKNTAYPLICIRNVIFPSYSPVHMNDFSSNWKKFSDQVTFNTYHSYKKQENTVSNKRCTMFFFYCPVRWDGSIHFCAYQHIFGNSFAIGNIADNDLRTIWLGRRLKVVRRQHRNLNFSQTCEVCEIRHGSNAINDNARQYNYSNNRIVNAINKFIKIT